MIDWTRVLELREEVGPEDFDEVVALFLGEVEEVISRLQATPDPRTFEADLHFLKGSALSLGFAEFSNLCASGETRAAAGQDISADLAQLPACYETSRGCFLSELPGRLAAT